MFSIFLVVLKDFPFFEESHDVFSRMDDEERHEIKLKLSQFLDDLKDWTDFRTRYALSLFYAILLYY